MTETLNEEIEKYNALIDEFIGTKKKLNKELSQDINTAEVIECNKYLEYLNNLIINQLKVIQVIEQAIEEKREELLKNEIEKKVIEKLKDKQQTNYNKEINTKIQKNIDDMTIQRFCFEREEAGPGDAYTVFN